MQQNTTGKLVTTSVNVELESSPYDDIKWEVNSFPSGTVIVTTGDTALSHLYVYGPAIEGETEREQMRYRYACDLVDLLNNSKVPAWLSLDKAMSDVINFEFAWEDGTSIQCIFNICGREKARQLFWWLIKHVRTCQGVQQLMTGEDSRFLEHVKSIAATQDPLRKLDIEGLEQFKQSLNSMPEISPLGPSEITPEMWKGDA